MQTLQADELLITELFNAQPNAVLWHHPVWAGDKTEEGEVTDFKLVYCNDQVSKTLEAPREALLGQTLLTTPTADEATRKALFDQFMQVWLTGEQKVYRYFHPVLHKHLESVRSRLKGGIITITRDRTAEQLQEEKARQDQNLLNSILDASLAGVLALDAVYNESGEIIDFLFTKVNQKVVRFLRKKNAGELIGKRYLSIVPTSGNNGMFDLKRQVVLTGKPVVQEFYYEGGGIDGWYHVSIVPLGRNGIVQTFTDITESKQDKESLARSAEQFRTVVNTSKAGMFTLLPVKDDKGEVEEFRFGIVNQAVASYIGQTAEVLTGSIAGIYFPAYKTNGLFNIYKDSYLTGKNYNFDFHYEDGYDVFFNIDVVKLGDEVLVTFTDHTSLKRLQREMEIKVEELKRSNANLEEFAYAASHDLQEPLRKVHYFAERLRKDLQNGSKEQLALLERMESATVRMKTLIDDLLSFSQVSTRQSAFEDVQLDKVLDHVLQDLETVVQETGAVITREPLPMVKGDESQLRQMLQNLVGNALKYRKPGVSPEIAIRHRMVSAGEPVMPNWPPVNKGYYHLLEVADKGIGFEQENAEKIFQVFQRLHGRFEYEGTGIGLAIVQKVVSRHKGFIAAEGQPGVGATFRVLLPV